MLGAFLPGDRPRSAGGDAVGKEHADRIGAGLQRLFGGRRVDGDERIRDRPLDKTTLLGLMGELEGRISGSVHYDNVAPCYLGGLQLMLEEEGIISQEVPCFDDWLWVMAYPGIKVSTAEARAILPAQYRRQDCISHGRYLAGFIHACHTRQPQLAAKLMQDVIAEPYRTRLLPGFAEARKAAQEIGALACGISGSGPTLFAVATTAPPRNAWPPGCNNTICKTTKVLFIFAVWIPQALDYWDNA